MTAPDIFLSYNREDQAVARRFADAFAAEGLNVWWDTALRSPPNPALPDRPHTPMRAGWRPVHRAGPCRELRIRCPP